MRVYDCRHACATMLLKAGVPLGEVARRLGHSVETLVSIYVGALDGDDAEANSLIDGGLADTRGRNRLHREAQAGDYQPEDTVQQGQLGDRGDLARTVQ